MTTNLVVGSGPSGVMAAKALLDAGQSVTLVDEGAELEADKRAVVRRLASEPVDSWDPALVAQVSGYAHEPGGKVPVKLAFGSRFPYADAEQRTLTQDGTKCLQSGAKGGLSTLWGAAVLPNAAAEFDGWPVSPSEMSPHYAEAARCMRVAGVHDDLEAAFPFHAPPAPAPRASRQADAALARMSAHRAALSAAGFRFGRSRLALRTEDGPAGKACAYSGLCLSGCPLGAVWSSAELLDELVAHRGLVYRPGLRATRVESAGGAVRLRARAASGAEETLEARRAFLACGPVSTTRLVASSLGWHDRELTMRYQPYFLLPLLSFGGVPGVETERLHTLAQAFVELDDSRVSSHTVHLQLYGYDEHIRDSLSFLGALPPLRRALAGRLMFFQGYLHSDEADGIRMSVSNDGAARLEARPSARAQATIGRAARAVAARSRDFGFLPLLPMLRAGVPGEGNHVGGIFPMRAAPGDQETDRLGRLKSLPGVHLVDSSVLPSLASTTFTYTVMANAHRIAAEAAAEGA